MRQVVERLNVPFGDDSSGDNPSSVPVDQDRSAPAVGPG
jgi:hypothetical protein